MNEVDAGLKPAEICRKYGISEHTFYRWKAKLSSMSVSDVKKSEAPRGGKQPAQITGRSAGARYPGLESHGQKKLLGLAREKEKVNRMQERCLFE
ncbi:MAG: transposase [Candidatus Obscuribacterales bacterium]|nr:transposase [Candidatus Obscuribacterales bacterium]